MKLRHRPVLVQEVLDIFKPCLHEKSIIVDATIGSGGHAQALLESGLGQLIAIDKDPDAIHRSQVRLKSYAHRVTWVRSDFRKILKVCMEHAPFGVDGVFVDFGLNMDALKDPERGFSFELEGPLDMRYDPWQSLTAEKVVNQFHYDKLIDILKTYGEEPEAETIVKAILEARKKGPIRTTTQLAQIVASAKRKRGKIHPATKTFMALRIFVNKELEGLEDFLVDAFQVLKIGGRLAVISYHSLEDRIVKFIFNRLALSCRCDPSSPMCVCESKPLGNVLTKKPVMASREEIRENPPSRSARLRAIEKIEKIRFKSLIAQRHEKKPPSFPFPFPT